MQQNVLNDNFQPRCFSVVPRSRRGRPYDVTSLSGNAFLVKCYFLLKVSNLSFKICSRSIQRSVGSWLAKVSELLKEVSLYVAKTAFLFVKCSLRRIVNDIYDTWCNCCISSVRFLRRKYSCVKFQEMFLKIQVFLHKITSFSRFKHIYDENKFVTCFGFSNNQPRKTENLGNDSVLGKEENFFIW